MSKDRFEEDLVDKRPLDDLNGFEEVEGYGDVDTDKVVPSGGGLLEDEEWGGYIWRTFSMKRDERSDGTPRSA